MRRAKEIAEKESADMKQRLSAILGELQGVISGGKLYFTVLFDRYLMTVDQGRSYVSPSTSYYSGANSAHPPPHNNASTPGSTASPGSLEVPQAPWSGASGGQQQQLQQQRHDLRQGLNIGSEKLGLDFLLEPSQSQQVSKIQAGQDGAQDTSKFQHMPMKHDWTDVRNDQALRARPSSSNNTTAGWEANPSARPQNNQAQGSPSAYAGGLPHYAIGIQNSAGTCPLDNILLDFLNERRQRAAEGLAPSDVVGPRYPSVTSLLNPSISAKSHPLSKVFTDILGTFPDISALPERVAVLYIMFLLMRWQISPTKENYARLPEWMRPQHAQLYIAHPAWIDHLPFPLMREYLAKMYSPEKYFFNNFFVPFTRTLRLHWPYEETDTLLKSQDGEELMINPVFERHLRNLDNWSLGEDFANTFPKLGGLYRLDYATKSKKGQ